MYHLFWVRGLRFRFPVVRSLLCAPEPELLTDIFSWNVAYRIDVDAPPLFFSPVLLGSVVFTFCETDQ